MGTPRTRLGLIAITAMVHGGCTNGGNGALPPGTSAGGQRGDDAGVAMDVGAGGSGGSRAQPTGAGGTNARDAAGGATVVDAASDPATATGDSGVQEQDYASLVNPWIETNKGRWFFSTPAAMPFGMVKLTPHSKNQDQGGGGYNYSVPTALGFCHVHGWMSTGLCVMPTSGGTFTVTDGENGWKSNYSHTTEVITPGYHKLHLDKYNLDVELTTTNRVGFSRYTFAQAGKADIVINLGGVAGPATMRNGAITQISPTEFEGHYDRTNGIWGGPTSVRTFFVIVLDKPASKLNTYQNSFGTSGYISYDAVAKGDVVQMKAALSYTSVANARLNLTTELNHWDFDRVRKASHDEWNNRLNKIQVTGGSHDQQVKFYTDLWHVLLGREMTEDVNGAYPDYTNGKGGNDNVLKVRNVPLNADGTPRFHIYNSDAFWLTQWNLNTLWGLAWPDVLDSVASGLLEMGRVGGAMDRGPNLGGYSYIMTGAPASMLVAAAYQKGAYSFDPMAAFQQIKKDHSPGGIEGANDFYISHGYMAGNAGVTLEANFEDWCAAQMASKLGLQSDYAEFIRRSKGWQNLYHPTLKFLFPKDANGNWTSTDPLSGAGWIEANSWQATWFTSHDVAKLVQLMGGKDAYCDKLNSAFQQSAPQSFVFGYSSGTVSYANQPGCSNAHLFNYAGKPWLTQYWVRQVKDKAYGGVTPDLGYGGHDEDEGQMGGISALMAMGLFAVQGTCGSKPIYDITSPIFDTVRIALDKKYYPGGEFVITTRNNSAANIYIQSATLNGQPQDNSWFYHSQFAAGGTLEITLGPQPNMNWGVTQLPPSDSTSAQ
ncbi:MAG TPA: GH92 family glycosyl hydrolase [Polyangia bacterium]|nr:GH92 family glycosyl hydrolase [Polyangia bacterium]